MKSRLHLHTNTGPNSQGYIIGEPAALLALSKALESAAKGVIGLETIQLYNSDGHEYELVIASDVSEDEWQNMPVPYNKQANPQELNIIKIYNSLKITNNQ